MSLQLGYCCINLTLKDVSVNRTLREASYLADPERAIQLAKNNLQSVLTILKWNEEHAIRNYRLSSDMFPHITNPNCIKNSQYAYELELFDPLLEKIGRYARRHGHRLTMHPGQFNQVGTPRGEVLDKTVKDLEFHADVLDRMGLDFNSVMVVHGGGTYGDKKSTLKRWKSQFWALDPSVQCRLVIENDERSYGIDDILKLHNYVGCPIVFDFHHYNCYHKDPQSPLSQVLPQVIESWGNLKPKFHLSEQAPNLRLGAHSDYVEVIPNEMLQLAKDYHVDLMIEAKAKELSVQRLYNKYFLYDKDQNKYILNIFN